MGVTGLAGRGIEEQALATALGAAASGRPCAVVVHGEAGVGKTRLVREACDRLGPRAEVLWGTCVHFAAASVPFAPVTAALRGWLARADAGERAAVLTGATELGSLLPSLGADTATAGAHEPGRLLPVIDLVLNRIADRSPTVLVIDDLHWADATSLDVLAYLIAGFRDQRLALLATCREEHRGEGHRLHGWLADMRRMPLFSEIHLDRLDLAATETQIAGLLGRPADLEVAARVHERSGGNPYLTELLVSGLDQPELPAAPPAALRERLLASWHGLTAAARDVTRVLAVGGRPMEHAVLAAVAADHGVPAARLPGCLTEARDHGVVQPDDQGRAWFRHPLLAEVLYDDLPPGVAAGVHASYVRVLEALPGSAGPVAADLAVHNDRAGRVDAAYRSSLAAADYAAGLRASAEESVHLERACALWQRVSVEARGSEPDRITLLVRAAEASWRLGRQDAAAAHLRQALDLLDREREPRLASTMLLRWAELAWEQAAMPGKKAVAPAHLEAVALTERFPDSPERARALGALAWAEGWDALPAAAARAEEAVRVARRSGSASALGTVLWQRASVHRGATMLADAEEAERLARSADDGVLLGQAALWRVNSLIALDRIAEATAVARAVQQDLLAAGAPQRAYFLAAQAAGGMLFLGQWDECRTVLRAALAARCTAITGAAVRLAAARLAVRTGRVAEGEQHLARALEYVAADFAGLRENLALAGAEVLTAVGEPERALDWLRLRIEASGVGPVNSAEELLVAGATAAANAAGSARDAGDRRGVERAVAALDELSARWQDEDESGDPRNTAVPAMRRASFAAEAARCRGDADQVQLWREAVDACRAAGAGWDEAVACRRCAEAMLAAGPERTEAGEMLRRAYRIAAGLGAEPLRHEVEALARRARVSLRDPDPAAATRPVPAVLAGLTAREREILGFLVAGRSNGEIARELVISDKTVSVHVSNILRKTGTTSRLEAAALADRLGVT